MQKKAGAAQSGQKRAKPYRHSIRCKVDQSSGRKEAKKATQSFTKGSPRRVSFSLKATSPDSS